MKRELSELVEQVRILEQATGIGKKLGWIMKYLHLSMLGVVLLQRKKL